MWFATQILVQWYGFYVFLQVICTDTTTFFFFFIDANKEGIKHKQLTCMIEMFS